MLLLECIKSRGRLGSGYESVSRGDCLVAVAPKTQIVFSYLCIQDGFGLSVYSL